MPTSDIMSKKRIVVLGATGMLGRDVMRVLASCDNAETVCLGSRDCDITDRETVQSRITELRPDVIINCAAYTAVDAAEDNQEAAEALNHHAPAYIAEAAKKTGSLLIHISTDYVFDGKASSPYTEDMPTAPLGTYGASKRRGEEAVIASGCRHVIIRTQWLYSTAGKNFLLTMKRLFETREQIGVVCDQTGSPTYTADLAAAIKVVAFGFKEGQDGIYNFSNSGCCTWYDFAVSIAALMATRCAIRPIKTSEYPTRATRPAYSVLCKEKIAATFGVQVPHWREGLRRCLEALED